MTAITENPRLILWGAGTPRTLRAHWTLCELGLEYEKRPIGSRTDETQTPEFKKLNAREKIPVLQDGDLTLAESRMKTDIEKKFGPRVALAFEDLVAGMSSTARTRILTGAQQLVTTVWLGKIYAALPPDKTKIAEYFLDAELEQLLNEAIEESHEKVRMFAERAKDSSEGDG